MKGEDKLPAGAVVTICLRATEPTLFTDNVLAPCAFCGVQIMHRPHVPAHSLLMCSACYAERAEPGDTAVVSRRSILEALAVLDRN